MGCCFSSKPKPMAKNSVNQIRIVTSNDQPTIETTQTTFIKPMKQSVK